MDMNICSVSSLDYFDVTAKGYLLLELNVGEYHLWLRSGSQLELWLRSGSQLETDWAYGFQYQPRSQPHGLYRGPLFEETTALRFGNFNRVMLLALEAIRGEGLVRVMREPLQG